MCFKRLQEKNHAKEDLKLFMVIIGKGNSSGGGKGWWSDALKGLIGAPG